MPATAPVIWKVMSSRVGAVDTVLLGDEPDDTYRVVVTVCDGEVDAQIIYPCAECGWLEACHGGEDCHS